MNEQEIDDACEAWKLLAEPDCRDVLTRSYLWRLMKKHGLDSVCVFKVLPGGKYKWSFGMPWDTMPPKWKKAWAAFVHETHVRYTHDWRWHDSNRHIVCWNYEEREYLGG